jgi:hypothetical protein
LRCTPAIHDPLTTPCVGISRGASARGQLHGDPLKRPFPSREGFERNLCRHGLWELQEREREKWLDALGSIGNVLRERRAAIVANLGGEKSLSPMELVLLNVVVRSHLILSSVDRYLLTLPCWTRAICAP